MLFPAETTTDILSRQPIKYLECSSRIMLERNEQSLFHQQTSKKIITSTHSSKPRP